MKSIFDKISQNCSKNITRTYSTSFSLGILSLNKELHRPIYNIYGFVRLADEIVDSFHNHDKEFLLNQMKLETRKSIKEKLSLNPVIHSFQKTVNKYKISWDLIEPFFESMEMDLMNKSYSFQKYDKYILGSAEVVGLMCLKVFVSGNEEKYNIMKPYAMKLGSAFQKVNFLRDMKNDYNELGRVYFPEIDINNFSKNHKLEIEKDIEEDFLVALDGIKMLPKSSKGGVYLAYIYYYNLFKKIKLLDPSYILENRVRISNFYKFYLMIISKIKYNLNLI